TATWQYATGALKPTRRVRPDGLNVDYSYDGSNRLTKVVTPESGSAGYVYAYDGYGRVTATTNPLGYTSTVAFDSLGRMTSQKDPLNNETQYAYDDLSRITQVTDPRGKHSYLYYAST